MFACVIASFVPPPLPKYLFKYNGLLNARTVFGRGRHLLPGENGQGGCFCCPSSGFQLPPAHAVNRGCARLHPVRQKRFSRVGAGLANLGRMIRIRRAERHLADIGGLLGQRHAQHCPTCAVPERPGKKIKVPVEVDAANRPITNPLLVTNQRLTMVADRTLVMQNFTATTAGVMSSEESVLLHAVLDARSFGRLAFRICVRVRRDPQCGANRSSGPI